MIDAKDEVKRGSSAENEIATRGFSLGSVIQQVTPSKISAVALCHRRHPCIISMTSVRFEKSRDALIVEYG